MSFIRKHLRQAIASFKGDSLFRNAVFLMSSTAIMSVLGFGFWFFIAHLYAPAQIGAASALIAITLLISNLSFFGLNAGLLRFLTTSKTGSRDINAALITVGAAAMLAAVAYLLWVGDDFAGGLGVFNTSLAGQLIFVLLMATISLNTFTDSVFIANRRAELHTIVYAVFGVVKLVLPLFLISLGSLGIFTAYVAAAAASLALSLILMWRYCGYHLLSRPNWSFITRSRRYASNNYVAVLLGGLPSQLMPSFVVRGLGEAHAAYFSMAWTMANLLYVIPSAITNSLLAESAHDISKQAINVRHAVRILSLILVPAVLGSILVAPHLLRLFGPQYSAGGTAIFQILALATFSIAANSIGNTIMNIEHRSGGIVIVQGVVAAVMIGLAWPLMKLGLVGIGLAMLAGNVAGNLTQAMLLARKQSSKSAGTTISAGDTSVPTGAVIQAFLGHYNLSSAQVGADIGGGDRSGTVVVTTASHKYVLKMYSTSKRTRHQLQEELKFTQALLAQGVPAPRIVANTSGQPISEVIIGNATWLCVLMNFEAGRHPATYSPILLTNMAQVQGRIHTIGLEYATSHQPDMLNLKAGSLRSTLVGYTPKGISHFDFYRGNILATGDKISCVLDFEGMRYDPVVVCLFFTLTTLYGSLHDPSQIELYLRSYQQVRQLNWAEKPIIRTALALRFHTPRLLLIRF